PDFADVRVLGDRPQRGKSGDHCPVHGVFSSQPLEHVGRRRVMFEDRVTHQLNIVMVFSCHLGSFVVGGKVMKSVSQRSSTMRAPRAREQHTSMQSPRCRSSGVRYSSRWSGVPSRTPVTQVPQIPCSQDTITSTPFATSTDAIDWPGGTS